MMQDTLGEGEFGKVVLASLNNFKGKPGEPVNIDYLHISQLACCSVNTFPMTDLAVFVILFHIVDVECLDNLY